MERLNPLRKKQENQGMPKQKGEQNPWVLPWLFIFDEHMKLGPAKTTLMDD
jgi:hypothetical protein